MKNNLIYLSMIILMSQTIAMDDKDRPVDLNAAYSHAQTADYDSKAIPCTTPTSKRETPKTEGMGAWESAWEKGIWNSNDNTNTALYWHWGEGRKW